LVEGGQPDLKVICAVTGVREVGFGGTKRKSAAEAAEPARRNERTTGVGLMPAF
jgi:hypothetical protein